MAQLPCLSFRDFWPHYVRQHSQPATRTLHFLGLLGALAALVAAAALGHGWLLVLAPLVGYGSSWIAHFFVEKNLPATFDHPLWSLLADLNMFRLMLTCRMKHEAERVGDGS